MRILLVDYHAGCMASTATALQRLGHEVAILSLSSHNRVLHEVGIEQEILSGPREQRLLNQLGLRRGLRLDRHGVHRAQAGIREAVQPDEAIKKCRQPEFDLAWVSFPPALYSRVLDAGVAEHVVVHVSHRFDMWLAAPEDRLGFHRRFRQDIVDGAITVVAADRFDQRYVHHYLGVEVPLLEPSFAYLSTLRNGSLLPGDPVVIGPSNINVNSPGLIALREEFARVPPGVPLPKTIHEQFGNYTFNELAQVAAVVMLPYSIYSISMSELASLGIPMYFPSDAWLTRTNTLNDVQLAPIYASSAQVQRFADGAAAGDPNVGPLSPEWLATASWRTFPNVEYWDSAAELLEKLGQRPDTRESARQLAAKWEDSKSGVLADLLKRLEAGLAHL